MGVKNYLIEGGSGTGKTTVAEELQRRGYHVIHGDRTLAYYGDPKTGEPIVGRPEQGEADALRWAYKRWIWPVHEVKSLVADKRNAMSFFCGHSANSQQLIGLFDAVFTLSIDLQTLNHRLADRPADEFGGKPAERALITRLHATNEDIPKNAVSIDATAPVAVVVDAILSKCADAG
jgi:broad-specificity NMP kinase